MRNLETNPIRQGKCIDCMQIPPDYTGAQASLDFNVPREALETAPIDPER